MTEEMLQIYSQIMAIAGGVFFWAAFLMFGFIARRYKVVFNRETFHGLLMIAPSGILIYAVLMMLKSSAFIKQAPVNDAIQLIAYLFLLGSGLLCLAATLKFARLIDELIKYKERA